jgi:hypothetical protein
LGGQRVGANRNCGTIRLQFLPSSDEIGSQSMSALGVGLHLSNQIFERGGEQFVEGFAVTIGEAFAGGFGGIARGQAVVMVEAAVVIPGRGQVDHPLERERKVSESPAAQVIRSGDHITPLGIRIQNVVSPGIKIRP